MSGQWAVSDKVEEGTSCFPRIFQEATNQCNLSELISQLLPDEVVIATTYIESLIKTCPIKMKALEGWETTVDGPYWVEKEDRSHMALLELENDPK